MAGKKSRQITRKSNIFGVCVIALICAAICVATFLGGRSIAAQNEYYTRLESEIQSQIEAEEERAEEIEEYSRYVLSDEFAEEMAKEKFGLVNEDELVIKSLGDE